MPTASDLLGAPDVPLAALRRERLLESLHRGRYAVCDSRGVLLDLGGDVEQRVWVRSSAKPFQALPLVASGAAESLGLTGEEIAVACGSHTAEALHLAAVRSILRKAGLPEDALQSGPHPPLDDAAAGALARAGERPRPIHGTCSGKHAGMLALCVYRGWDTTGYREPEHPAQRAVLQAVRGMCGPKEGEIVLGGDGCGAPAFALPLRSLAMGFARLAEGKSVPDEIAGSASRIRRAMREHPFMVAGSGRLDTRLMGNSEVVSKSGAEGVFAAGMPDGTGLAIKVSDGSGRAVEPAALSLLRGLGARLPEPETAVRDLHGAVVGSLKALV